MLYFLFSCKYLQPVILVFRNLKTAFRNPLPSEGVYFGDLSADKTNVKRPMQPVKLLSVDGLKKALRFETRIF